MARVIHFEIPISDPERAAAFYRKVFDWRIEKWAGPMEYWMVTTGTDGPGIDGGLMKRSGPVTNTVGVDSLDSAIAAVKNAGGKVVAEKASIPTVGYFAHCEDTEGNLFGLMQADAGAK
jgi:predicted enzyme related to lactoylglutathione lyase